MRVFFGLELDTTTTLSIADWRDRHTACDGRPVPPANFHITLAFIGQLQNPALDRLSRSVDEWLGHSDVHRGTLMLDRIGYWSRPGIYWLGPSIWPEQLTLLARKLNSLANAAGGKRDRNPFVPHVSLYRRCNEPPPAPTMEPAIALSYQHVSLFESRQSQQGVSYHPLEEWNLLPGTGL